MIIHVFDIEWDLVDEETGREVDREEEGLPEEVDLEIDDDEDVDTAVADQLSDDYGFCVKSFKTEVMLVEDQIRKVLRKYFEGNAEYDPDFSAQDAIDEISAIVGM